MNYLFWLYSNIFLFTGAELKRNEISDIYCMSFFSTLLKSGLQYRFLLINNTYKVLSDVNAFVIFIDHGGTEQNVYFVASITRYITASLAHE